MNKWSHPYLRTALATALANGLLVAVAGHSGAMFAVEFAVGVVAWGFLIAWMRAVRVRDH